MILIKQIQFKIARGFIISGAVLLGASGILFLIAYAVKARCKARCTLAIVYANVCVYVVYLYFKKIDAVHGVEYGIRRSELV